MKMWMTETMDLVTKKKMNDCAMGYWVKKLEISGCVGIFDEFGAIGSLSFCSSPIRIGDEINN